MKRSLSSHFLLTCIGPRPSRVVSYNKSSLLLSQETASGPSGAQSSIDFACFHTFERHKNVNFSPSVLRTEESSRQSPRMKSARLDKENAAPHPASRDTSSLST